MTLLYWISSSKYLIKIQKHNDLKQHELDMHEQHLSVIDLTEI